MAIDVDVRFHFTHGRRDSQTDAPAGALGEPASCARPSASYDGYASWPLVTDFGKLILAEFD